MAQLTRKQWEALGSLMLPLEIGGRRQLHPKTAEKLIALGYVETKIHSSADRLGKFTWTEHLQTHAGSIAFCDWASKQKDTEV